jgi:2,4-dienoyl-CoA reductase-like NADH-dependent reductase (Old Yellow Enzyme family)
MAELFEGTSFNGMSLANRFVRSATWEGLADMDGAVSPRLTEMMVALARGEVGLIISSYAFVSPEGQSSPRQLAVYEERFLPGLRDIVRRVHTVGGRIALQLAHAGCQADAGLSGLEPIGPSAVEQDGRPICRMAGSEDMASFVAVFARAADLANKQSSTRPRSMLPMAFCSASFSPRRSTREQTNMAASSRTRRGCCSR